MFYIVYKITNKVDGKIYVGSHKTKNLNDKYMGSGKYLRHAVKKHGAENFEREVLFVYDNPDEMYAKEAEIVNEDFLALENTYNLRVGGFGGFDYINSTGQNLYGQNGQSGYGLENLVGVRGKGVLPKLLKERGTYDKFKQAISKSQKARFANGAINGFLGKRHSEETKSRISQKSSQRESGVGNSQYGTCWIWHELIGRKKIKKDLLPAYIAQGWFKGGKILKF